MNSDKDCAVAAAEFVTKATAQKSKDFSVDPLMVIAVLSLIVGVIRMILECKNSNRECVALMRSPGPLARTMLRVYMRKEFPDLVKDHGMALYESLLEAGSSLDDVTLQKTLSFAKESLQQ